MELRLPAPRVKALGGAQLSSVGAVPAELRLCWLLLRCVLELLQLPLGDAEDEDAATALAAAALSNTFNHYEKCTPLGANIQGSSCLPPAGRPSVW